MARTVGRGVDTLKENLESIKDELIKTKKINEELVTENTELKTRLEESQENSFDSSEGEDIQYKD